MTKKRKVKFYALAQNKGKGFKPASILKDVLDFSTQLAIDDRVHDIDDHRFCYLDSANFNGTVGELIFKSAKRGYLPNLIHRHTLKERANPKDKDEGETEKTHAMIKFSKTDVYLVLEVNGLGISMYNLDHYFKLFLRKYLKYIGSDDKIALDYEPLAKEDFLDEINRMSRVVNSSIYVEKQILGSAALNFSNRTDSVQHQVEILIKAKRKDNIVQTVKDTFNKLAGGRSEIKRMRVQGKDNLNNDVSISTSFLEKTAFIEVDQNPNDNVISTTSVFRGLKENIISL